MSQFLFDYVLNGEKIEVLAGWDKPMQEYFMTIFGPDGESLWSSIDHPDETNSHGIEALRLQLVRLGIDGFPPQLWDEIVKSGKANEGNVICQFNHIEGKWEMDRCDLEKRSSV